MTSKEKAKELYVKYYKLIESPLEKHTRTKQCALIAVDELIYSHNNDNKWYWQEVKNEIEKL
jgi:predicted Ser/Thr protein kinase